MAKLISFAKFTKKYGIYSGELLPLPDCFSGISFVGSFRSKKSSEEGDPEQSQTHRSLIQFKKNGNDSQ
jgi:hypothetical protein